MIGSRLQLYLVTNIILIQKFQKFYVGILLVVFAGVLLQGPISVISGNLFPSFALIIKSWKEILMFIAALVALYLIFKTKQFQIFSDKLIIALVVYALINIILLLYHFQGPAAASAGLVIDLRYLLFFGLIYVAMYFYPQTKPLFIKVATIGAAVVIGFAVLQAFVLPADFLKYIGYGPNTIAPYLTIDQNNAFIRVSSTLRGPNPLGAYALIVMTTVVSLIIKKKAIFREKKAQLYAILLFFGGLIALWASYSRSAWIGAFISLIILLAVAIRDKVLTKRLIGWGIGLVAIIGLMASLAGGGTFISNVILHENPNGGSNVSSNEGHVSSLANGTSQLLTQPLGDGIGSTGSASLLGNNPEIIENQYLFIAHEVGWLGLAVFVYISGVVLVKLCKVNDWLSLSVLSSGVGLMVVGLLLPVWVDDTVAIVWWGLAAVALAPMIKGVRYGKTTIN